MTRRSSRPAVAALTALALAAAGAAATVTAGSASAASCASRTNNTLPLLLECVTLDGVREHQAALQAIADANGGTRAAGTAGYTASVAYVTGRLRAAGWRVTEQTFSFPTFTEVTPSVLQQLAPFPTTWPNRVMSYSGSGDVTGSAASPSVSTGCNAADWAGFPAGSIAVVQRGGSTPAVTCTFALKAANAAAAGAIGVVIYNNVAGELNGTLGSTFTLDLPVVGVTADVGLQIVNTSGVVLRLTTDTRRETTTSSNVLAELPGKNTSNVVMAGAHLDSVAAGPGINDNGSGSAAILEVAEQLSKVKPQNTIRLAWWGAEEANLVGSSYYVGALTDAEYARIALYLNFDMIGSPNHVFFVYDGDNSDGVGAGPGPAGSAQIEKTFAAFFSARGLATKGTDFDGRSDYGPFIAVGIPSGGLFTGAEGIKSAQEASIWGGTAGQAYDPCYHQACDTYANNNDFALATNADAVANTVLSYGMSTSLINGTKSKGNYRPPVDPKAPALF